MTHLNQTMSAINGKTKKEAPMRKKATAKAIVSAKPPKLNPRSVKAASSVKSPVGEKLIKLLQAKGGATLTALVKQTSWKPHTIRAAISKLRSEGFKIVFSHNAKNQPVYRITKQSKD